MSDYYLKYTNEEIDGKLDAVTRRNLLDNWYFGNPVNQRGQSSYSSNWAYSIDRWLIPESSVPVTITSGGISFNTIDQFTAEVLPSGVYTASVLTSNGALYTGSAKYESGELAILFYGNGVVEAYLMGDEGSEGHPRLRIQALGSLDALTLVAVKLELGDTQTLAHQENGEWVLNEIPDYGEELRKCQRYFCKSFPLSLAPISVNANIDYATMGTARKNGAYSVSFPVEMRTMPTIAKIGTAFCFAENIDGSESTTYDSSIVPAGITSRGFEIFNSFYNGFATFGMCWTASADL